jgi:hypothetical protein
MSPQPRIGVLQCARTLDFLAIGPPFRKTKNAAGENDQVRLHQHCDNGHSGCLEVAI